jgi:hypothetical protein
MSADAGEVEVFCVYLLLKCFKNAYQMLIKIACGAVKTEQIGPSADVLISGAGVIPDRSDGRSLK